MANNHAGHLLKFKNEQGEWVPLPLAIVNVYDTYVAYCNERQITPVSETEYYVTLGNLKTYVDQLAGSADNIATLTAALSEGTLPLSLGGTGKTFATELAFIQYIFNSLADNYSVLTESEFNNAIAPITEDIRRKFNADNISSGTLPPDEAGFPGEYYFQYEA